MAGTAAPSTAVHRSKGVVRIEAALTCSAGGVVDETVIGEAYGRLVGVLYDGGLDAAATISIKQKPGNAVSVPVVTYTTGTEGTPVFFHPTDVVTTDAGADIAASANAVGVNRDIYVGGKITVTVASGGVSETAKIALIVVEDPIGEQPLTV